MNAPSSPIIGPQDRFASLEAVRGETYCGRIGIFNADGVTPAELTGFTVTMFIWEGGELKGTVVCPESEVEGAGWLDVDISAAATAALNPVAHHFELWADNGAGQTKLILWGWLWLRGECLS